ncbi:hypothetical protein CJD36_022800 [Flavipsychrobacter stenotrophus]|uniref:Uncharacterized protein n=1 Tax=Flavipsychrobacter stenotrophus TaxID=2077091 RepID=A0A2S7SQ37_9BACT|nr:hypothetical protein [Flavipsychrobacter stenotrophus]PQJ08725.1 hypothetical protein CJD36_022800 [Flavipsychrobacter stenotrophus]
MNKPVLLLIALLLSSSCLFAQNPRVEKSETFEAPVVGWNKVLLLKNGNTFYFHFTRRDGIEVNVFDKSRKPVAAKEITSELWNPRKLPASVVEGLYEINGEPVLFLAQFEGKLPTLYRLRFDPFNGDLVKEEVIGTMSRSGAFDGSADKFHVEKDPQSDCYAVTFFNLYERGAEDRIKVIHYNGSHKPINLGYYTPPDDSLNYLNYIGSVVDGDKRVYLATYGSSNRKGENAHVFVSRLNATDSVFQHKALEFTEDFKDTKSVMHYNHVNNTLQLFTLTYAANRGGAGVYLSFMSYIDPESLKLNSVKTLGSVKANEYVHNKLGLEKNYQGMPQHMIVNKDNSTTILAEEMTHIQTVHRNGNSTSTTYTTALGGIGITELNEDGTERNGYVMMKKQIATGTTPPLFMSTRRKGKWSIRSGYSDHNSFMSYDYINTDKNRYVIYNDDLNNGAKEDGEKGKVVAANITKMNTVCYSLNDATLTRGLVFGPSDSDDKYSAVYIEASDYLPATRTYATIVIEREGRDKVARMAWLIFE